MQKAHLLSISVFCIGLFLLFSCNQNLEQDFKQYPADYLFAQRAFPHNKIPKLALRNALIDKTQIMQGRDPQEGYDDNWTLEGPDNIGGRITDIEMRSDDLNTVYAGSASGGVYKSNDQGISWIPIFDEAASLSIGDIAIAPSNENVLYVGTGEANAGGGSLAYDGLGVYRSADQGFTWTSIGLEEAGSIGKIQVDPSDENTLFVAAMGNLFGNDSDRGIYRSNDAGQNWEQVLFVNDSTGGIDLAIHPENNQIIYAAMWQRVRRPNYRDYGGNGSGIYKSTNGGDTWEELKTGLPQNGDEKGRIGLAISPSDPNIIYAYYAERSGGIQGIYKTEDNGNTWVEKSTSGINDVAYIWWFGKIFVAPHDPDRLYVTSLYLFQSNDGANSWSPTFEGVHADQHAVFMHPQNPLLTIIGNDGGVYSSSDAGENYTHSPSISNIQFYTCEIDESEPENIYGGSQDNGTLQGKSNEISSWFRIFGGDGFRVIIDPTNNAYKYLEYQYGNIFRIAPDLDNWENATDGIGFNDRKNWNTPIAINRNATNVLYTGTQRMYKTTDYGDNWDLLSDDLSNGPYEGNLTFGTITTIDVSEVDDHVIYAGTDDGNVWISHNAGIDWLSISSGIPKRWITQLKASKHDKSVVYCTVSGFRYNEALAHVFKSVDEGNTWIDISGNLPDIPVNTIIEHPENENELFIATDIGVFYTLDGGEMWNILGEGLPNVPILDLDIHPETKYMLAASFGRSMYSYILPEVSAVSNVHIDHERLLLFPNPATDIINISIPSTDELDLNCTIYSELGQKVSNFEIQNSDNYELEVNGYQAGHYWMTCRGGMSTYKGSFQVIN